jgi:hypothetical protein
LSTLLHHGLSVELSSVGRLLRDPLTVPRYQRGYSWEVSEVEQFWQDVHAAMLAQQPVYFLGTLVLSAPKDGDERAVVIDGQQRLATTAMLLAALRDALSSRGETSRASSIDNRYLRSVSLETGRYRPQMLMNTRDHDFFERVVLDGEGVEPEGEGQINIDAAFRTLSTRLNHELEAAGPHWVEYVNRWIRYLDGRAGVVLVKVDDDADAFLIFETLNDRGLPLAIADVVKNYLFGLARHNLETAEALWLDVVGELEYYSVGDITKFLRQWWSSRNGATRERELYDSIRKSVVSQEASLVTLDDMRHAATHYAATLIPDHPYWSEFDPDAAQAVDVLNRLGLEQFRPLLIAAMARFDSHELTQLAIAFIGWSVRGLVVGGVGGGVTERAYAEAAQDVWKKRVHRSEDIGMLLRPVIPSDSEFEGVLSSRTINRKVFAKYLLLAIQSGRSGTPRPQVQPRSAGSDLVVVPIVPRTARQEDGWHASLFTDEGELREVATLLGNLVLVKREDNARLGEEPNDRLGALSVGEPVLADCVDASDLTFSKILARQQAMAMEAVGLWPGHYR